MDKIAVVTAASSGIGRACAEVMAENGYTLMLFSRSDKIKEVAEATKSSFIQGDLTSSNDIVRLINGTLEKYGRIDAVIANGGHSAKGDLLAIPDEDWEQGFNLLFTSMVRIARNVVPIMEEQGVGSIVNISSFAAKEPSLEFPISSAVRAGVSSFTKMFAHRYGEKGIRMNNVLPGFVDSYEVSEDWLTRIPAHRPAKTREIAETAYFLASESSSYINGQDIVVDGGLSQSI